MLCHSMKNTIYLKLSNTLIRIVKEINWLKMFKIVQESVIQHFFSIKTLNIFKFAGEVMKFLERNIMLHGVCY